MLPLFAALYQSMTAPSDVAPIVIVPAPQRESFVPAGLAGKAVTVMLPCSGGGTHAPVGASE
jgi:hypothetical protein